MAKQGLFSMLGLGNPVPQVDPTSGGMLQSILGKGPVINEAGATTAGMENWQPHKPTILGALADAYLMSRGMKPAYADAREARNINEAMQGFADNPMAAIERLARVKGHEGDAWKMYENYVDDKRQQGNLDRQNNIFDMKKEELVYNRVASMMGAANKDTWGTMRQLAQSVANKYDVNVDDIIPTDYNPASIEYIRAGAIKPKDQERLEQSDRRLDQGDRRLDQGDQRLTETNRHNTATEHQAATNEAGRDARHNSPAAKPQASTVMTKYGVGQVNKDKTQMLLKRGDKYYLYLKGGVNANGSINWVPQGEVHPK
jgi:hypothetical protein